MKNEVFNNNKSEVTDMTIGEDGVFSVSPVQEVVKANESISEVIHMNLEITVGEKVKHIFWSKLSNLAASQNVKLKFNEKIKLFESVLNIEFIGTKEGVATVKQGIKKIVDSMQNPFK